MIPTKTRHGRGGRGTRARALRRWNRVARWAAALGVSGSTLAGCGGGARPSRTSSATAGTSIQAPSTTAGAAADPGEGANAASTTVAGTTTRPHSDTTASTGHNLAPSFPVVMPGVPGQHGAPVPITPLAGGPALPGEGAWTPAGGDAATSGVAVYTTELRPAGGSVPVAVALVDQSAARLALYAGVGEPAGTWPMQGFVSPDDRPALLAEFNSGFKIVNYRTGWFAQGRTAMALQNGTASLVIYRDGVATVGQWGRDVGAMADVVAVRQNLTLLVDGHEPVPRASIASGWGAVVQGGENTWRSGVGVTASGDLVYVGGPDLLPLPLAQLLVAAGAIRAMELDINPQWVWFSTYVHDGGQAGGAITGASNLLPNMSFSPSHYLQPFQRDFFAVFSR